MGQQQHIVDAVQFASAVTGTGLNNVDQSTTATIAEAAAAASRMAHLPPAALEERRLIASARILSVAAQHSGHEWYALTCPCNIDCGHMPQHEIPRIMLPMCYHLGELDFFFVVQPFLATHNFKVRWH